MFDNLLGVAKSLLGSSGAGVSTDQVAGAVADHVGGLDATELVNHLTGMIPNLPDNVRSELASTVVGALGQAGTSANDVSAAGVPVTDALSGDHAALGALLQQATSNPAGLKDAAVQFISNNPQLVQQYAPALLQGVLGKLGV